jgi:hypothetical protein
MSIQVSTRWNQSERYLGINIIPSLLIKTRNPFRWVTNLVHLYKYMDTYVHTYKHICIYTHLIYLYDDDDDVVYLI